MMAHQAKIRMVAKDPAEKLARQRLSVLQLAQALGSVSAACRRSGMDRTSFYDWKRRFQTHGLEGLKDLPPVHRTHPHDDPAGGGGAGAGAVRGQPGLGLCAALRPAGAGGHPRQLADGAEHPDQARRRHQVRAAVEARGADGDRADRS